MPLLASPAALSQNAQLRLLLLGLLACAVGRNLPAAEKTAAKTTAEVAFSVDDEASLNSEQLLVERRALRLEQLPAPPAPPEVDGEIDNPIDRFIVARWKACRQRQRPQLCDDATFLRRVYLDVIGVIPTAKEVDRFLASAAKQAKREKLVDQLLARDADYAAHWTDFLGRRAGEPERARARRHPDPRQLPRLAACRASRRTGRST